MKFSKTQKPPLGSLINWAHPLSRGLVGCWPMNETSGNIVKDLSLNGRNGTFVGSSIRLPSTMGSVVNFTSVNQASLAYINCNDTLSFAPNKPFSLLAWIYATSFNSGNQAGFPIISKYNSAGGVYSGEYSFSVEGNVLYFQCLEDSPIKRIKTTGSQVLSLNTWYQCVATYDGSGGQGGLNLYLDGVYTPQTKGIENSYTQMIYYSSSSFLIGGLLIGDNTYYAMANGGIANALVYNRALSPQDVAQLYYSPYAMFEKQSKWWFPAAAGGLNIPVAMKYYGQQRRR
jgi:hypothetical protein